VNLYQTKSPSQSVHLFESVDLGVCHSHQIYKSMSSVENCDVLICGAGPTGVLLGAYLSRLNVSTVILEKESGVTTDPRGIALDEDGVRSLQGLGLYNDIFTKIGSG